MFVLRDKDAWRPYSPKQVMQQVRVDGLGSYQENAKSPTRWSGGVTQMFITDGLPLDLASRRDAVAVMEFLKANGYAILHAVCLVRTTSARGFFAVGEIAATKGDGDLVYRFVAGDNLDPLPTPEAVLKALVIRQSRLCYRGEPLDMGKGQYAAARVIAKRLATEHLIRFDATPIYVPCWTRKGRGGWGRTVQHKAFGLKHGKI